jgi:hypothetical protein
MKKIKYFETKKLINVLIKHKNNIIIICHNNYMNNFDMLKIKCLLVNSDVQYITIRNNVIKKLFKNILLNNLIVGPTKFFIFSKFENFETFFSKNELNKKIIPLAVFFNKKIYNYKFFISCIKSLEFNNIMLDQQFYEIRKKFILNLKNINTKPVFMLNNFLNTNLKNLLLLSKKNK